MTFAHADNEIASAIARADQLVGYALGIASGVAAQIVRRSHPDAVAYVLNRACTGDSYPFELNSGTVLTAGSEMLEADDAIIDTLYPLLSPVLRLFHHQPCPAVTTNDHDDLVIDFAAADQLAPATTGPLSPLAVRVLALAASATGYFDLRAVVLIARATGSDAPLRITDASAILADGTPIDIPTTDLEDLTVELNSLAQLHMTGDAIHLRVDADSLSLTIDA
ncbi:hypothetical protein GS504_01295 [Rhodococcus hoagii]|nr:hypothetical protein [Prescottella equi]NKS71692.1 hypothetical protein [Prescottella equi]